MLAVTQASAEAASSPEYSLKTALMLVNAYVEYKSWATQKAGRSVVVVLDCGGQYRIRRQGSVVDDNSRVCEDWWNRAFRIESTVAESACGCIVRSVSENVEGSFKC